MTRIAVYPGTFDPITNGHLDILKKSGKLFDKIILAVAEHTGKETLFSTHRRKKLCQKAVESIANVEVMSYKGLSVEFCRQVGAVAMIRGLRAVSDFEFELQIAMMNKNLDSEIDTVFLVPHSEYLYLSSSMVKSVISLGGDLSHFIPECVQVALKEKYKR